MAMNKEFTDLVQEFLSDGYISPRECAVLLKKAEKLGIDVDEAELYIAAQQKKEDIKIDQAMMKRKGSECPYCGGPINDLTDKCPHRGCEKAITPQASEELEKILEVLENALVSMKSWEDFDKNKAVVERYERKARMYYSNNPKIKALLAEVEEEKLRAESQFKSMERKETITSIVKNKWVWAASAIVFGLIIAVIGFATDSEIALFGALLVMGGVYGLMFAGGLHKR